MKIRWWLKFTCAFVFLALISCVEQRVLSFSANEKHASPDSLELLPLSNPAKPTELEQAYLDSFSILKYKNSCSEFYGGSAAIAALNELAQQMKPTRLDRRIGIRMTGDTTIITSVATGYAFRLFKHVEVNLNGPFYRGNPFSDAARVPRVGPFEPNTREARVTTVLHELGHLIRRPDGQWVLPNDGENLSESQKNTQRVLEVCGAQVKALHNISFAEELLGAQSAAPLRSNVLNGSGQ